MLKGEPRRLLLIVIFVGLSVATLAFQTINIDVLGAQFQRLGTGPLGLRLGLDLQGGVHLVYQAIPTSEKETPTDEDMEGVRRIIETRVNAYGVTEPAIQLMGDDRIMIQLPGVTDIEEAKQLIGQTAVLEFKERTCTDAQDPRCSTYIDAETGLTGERLSRSYSDRHPTTGAPIVRLEFDSQGAKIFGDLTTRLVGTNNRIAIFIDNDEIVAPVAQAAILGGQAFVEGPDFTFEKVRTIAIQLESGRLPIPIKVIQEQDVDATLGADAMRKSLLGGYVGLGLVVLFMLLYYRVPGLVASISLLSYLLMVLAVLKLIPVTLTLAGIAGVILSIGMAVDANILIFERMKEELRTGRSLLSATETGFNRAWPAIRDSNVSTFITCAILFWFGSRLGASLVVGFSLTLFIGVAISMFSAIFISRTLLRASAGTPLGRTLALYAHITKRSDTMTAQTTKGRE
jgi:preprotein translocase subunit SecD